MSDTIHPDLRIVLMAAMAWIHEHDFPGNHAEGMDETINFLGGASELSKAIDRLTEST